MKNAVKGILTVLIVVFALALVGHSVKAVDASYEYVLIPRLSSSSMEKIVLSVNQDTFWVEGMTLYPKGGNVSHYRLKGQKMNIKTSPDLFRPKTPPGVRLQIF